MALAVRHSLRDREVRGSIPGRVKPRTLKLVLAADPPCIWHNGFSAKSGRPGVRIMSLGVVYANADRQQVQQQQVYDCFVGAAACRNSGSIVYNGATILCCRPGDSISSSITAAFDTTFGGQSRNVCKCHPGRLATVNGRPMTPAEKNLFLQEMNKWSANFQREMSTFFTKLNANLNNMFNRWKF
ncbi:hypothetical protein ElyMa_007050600 [Elysia marginata]|uniref:Uncharacterized protein n=1 Tax=Elysia marginata TaxID=1093978 RepID=A0AAV4JWG8_9GAST|nr:hypothetical protein ElyMa_007050600 [Elysia marginata]